MVLSTINRSNTFKPAQLHRRLDAALNDVTMFADFKSFKTQTACDYETSAPSKPSNTDLEPMQGRLNSEWVKHKAEVINEDLLVQIKLDVEEDAALESPISLTRDLMGEDFTNHIPMHK